MPTYFISYEAYRTDGGYTPHVIGQCDVDAEAMTSTMLQNIRNDIAQLPGNAGMTVVITFWQKYEEEDDTR